MGGSMKWKAEFLIGIEAIDSQHHKIFQHLLAIENALTKRDPWHIVRYLIAQMADAMKLHLAVEEALLEIIRYPGFEAHCAAHARLKDATVELEERIRDSMSAADLVAFFEGWFIGHVLSADREYAAYAKQRLAEGKVLPI